MCKRVCSMQTTEKVVFTEWVSGGEVGGNNEKISVAALDHILEDLLSKILEHLKQSDIEFR